MDSDTSISQIYSPRNPDSFKVSRRFFNDWRSSEALCAIFSLIGITVATVDYEYTYSFERTFDNCRVSLMILNPMKIIVLITTLIALFYLLIGIYHKSLWESYMNSVYSHSFFREISFSQAIRGMSKYRYIEIALLLVIPYPKVMFHLYIPLRHQFKDYIICYNFSEISYLVMFFRLEIVLRAISLFSPYEDHLARNYCRRYKVPADARFGIKCLIAQYPLYVIGISAITAMVLFSIVFRILERPLDSMTTYYYSDYMNAIWFLFENMSTLGYGEYLPVTDLGRVVTVLGYFVGTSLFSLLVLILDDKIGLNTQQSKAFTRIFKVNAAANAVVAAMVYFHIKKKYGKHSNGAKECFRRLRRKCKEMKNKRIEVEELSKGNDEAIVDMKISVSNIELKMRKMDKVLDNLIFQLKDEAEKRGNKYL